MSARWSATVFVALGSLAACSNQSDSDANSLNGQGGGGGATAGPGTSTAGNLGSGGVTQNQGDSATQAAEANGGAPQNAGGTSNPMPGTSGTPSGGTTGNGGSGTGGVGVGGAGTMGMGGTAMQAGGNGGSTTQEPAMTDGGLSNTAGIGNTDAGTPDMPSGVDCTGEFGEEQVILTRDNQVIVSTPTMPEDELELFFVEHALTQGGPPQVMRAERASRDADFGEAAVVTEVQSACQDSEERGISITADGLRLYIDCYTGISSFSPGPLRVAERASRDAAFTVEQTSYGDVGPQINVSPDELWAYSSSEMNTTSPPRQYSRASTQDPFANGEPIPGLEDVAFGTPSITADGLTLYGGIDPDLVVTTRTAPDAPFAAPSVVFSGDSSGAAYRFPEISPDCRTLYFVRIDQSGGGSTFSLRMAKR